MCFRFAVILIHDFRPLDANEVRTRLVRHRFCQQCLASPGRPVEQHPLGRVDSQRLEKFGMLERQFNHLANPAEFLLEAANVLVRYAGRPQILLLDRLLQYQNLCVSLNLHNTLRLHSSHCKHQPTTHQRQPRHNHGVALGQRAAVEAPQDNLVNPGAELYATRLLLQQWCQAHLLHRAPC